MGLFQSFWLRAILSSNLVFSTTTSPKLNIVQWEDPVGRFALICSLPSNRLY